MQILIVTAIKIVKYNMCFYTLAADHIFLLSVMYLYRYILNVITWKKDVKIFKNNSTFQKKACYLSSERVRNVYILLVKGVILIIYILHIK